MARKKLTESQLRLENAIAAVDEHIFDESIIIDNRSKNKMLHLLFINIWDLYYNNLNDYEHEMYEIYELDSRLCDLYYGNTGINLNGKKSKKKTTAQKTRK